MRTYCWALLAGAIYSCSFAPINLSFLSLIGIAMLFHQLHHAPTRQAGFFISMVFGIGMFGLGVSWIYHSIHLYGGASPLLAALLVMLFIVPLSLIHGAMGYTYVRYHQRYHAHALFFSALWVLFELIRSHIFTGFPWLLAGNAQVGTPLGAFAPIGSVWLVSGLTAWLAVLLYRLRYPAQKKRRYIALVMLCILGAAHLLAPLQWTHPTDKRLTVALVQGNIPQAMRWSEEDVTHIIDTYVGLSLPYLQRADWIVWPESAIPVPRPIADSTLVTVDAKTLLTGIPAQTPTGQYTNQLWVVGTDTTYDKTHLVPFGEYVPFEGLLRGLITFFDLPMSAFVPGQYTGPLLHDDWAVGPAICYEMAYPTLVRTRAQDSDFLLTLSNDAWFGDSFAPHQHLQITQMRALETGKPLVRATNNGITALIDPKGKVVNHLPHNTMGVLLDTVTAYTGQTPWVRYGVWPWLGLLLLLLLPLRRKEQ